MKAQLHSDADSADTTMHSTHAHPITFSNRETETDVQQSAVWAGYNGQCGDKLARSRYTNVHAFARASALFPHFRARGNGATAVIELPAARDDQADGQAGAKKSPISCSTLTASGGSNNDGRG